MNRPTQPYALVVDDEADVRRLAMLALSYEGWRVVEAENGREALRMIREQRPDLLVVDVMMPEMTGPELCRRLIEDMRMAEIPIVLISAIQEGSSLIKTFKDLPLARTTIVRKPFSTEQMLRGVQEVVPKKLVQRPMAGNARRGPQPVSSEPAPTERKLPRKSSGSVGVPTPPPWMRLVDELSKLPTTPATSPTPAQPPPLPRWLRMAAAEESRAATPEPATDTQSSAEPAAPDPEPTNTGEAPAVVEAPKISPVEPTVAPEISPDLPVAPAMPSAAALDDDPSDRIEAPETRLADEAPRIIEHPAITPSRPSLAESGDDAFPSHTDANDEDLPEHLTGYRVLIVEDHDDLRVILDSCLSLYHEVETATNGMEALRKLDGFAPDFVISDIEMPELDGFGTAEAIRRHPRLYMIPIFFLTGRTDKGLRRKAWEVGANLYLRKPIDPLRLLDYIDHFIETTGLRPGAHGVKPATPRPADAGQPHAQRPPLRVLIVNPLEAESRLLRMMFDERGSSPVGGGPFELILTEDPFVALGNLPRWQPDMVLINPRNGRLGGIEFAEALRMEGREDQPAVLFVGTQFENEDVLYSRQTLGRGLLALDGDEEFIARKLSELALELAQHEPVAPKLLTHARILAEQAHRAAVDEHADEADRTMVYAGIQEYFDSRFHDG